MPNPTPPPLPNGYQPVEGEGLRQVVVRSARGKDYQSEAVELLYEFPRPLSYSEALPAIDALQDEAGEQAQAKLNAVLDAKNAERDAQVQAAQAALSAPSEPGPAPTQAPPQAPPPFKAPPLTGQQVQQNIQAEIPQAQQVPTQQAGPSFQIAEKPNGKGTVKYLPQSQVSTMDMVNAAKKALEAEGFPESEVHIFDNRDRLATKGGYSAGSIKTKNDSFLQQTLGDEFLGDVEFNDDGSIGVYVNGKGKEALTALKVARQAQQASQPQPF